MKKRVLLVSEAHHMFSGFGTYAKELLTRLYQTDKYELAEFASYGKPDLVQPPWIYYTNVPRDNDQEQLKQYNANTTHQFGSWRFEKVCLDFKPDIVLSYRDPWMDNWIADSSLRPYFHWVWMPTVDSAPQRQEWIDTFCKCDAVLSYSEYGGKVLKEQGKERMNYIGCASPGINPEIYKPIEKKQLRQSMGIDSDCFIVGTVMRNQKRKLFFELMKGFRLFLDQAPPEIAKKTFLYLHTSYPEKQGWDIAQGIITHKIVGKVLMTYVCKLCGKFAPNMFQDALSICKHCGNCSATCPTVSMGLEIPDLAKIYNLFDIYTQYAICEGFGMPQIEAAACGVPVTATNYSAMEDVVKFTRGYPIPVKTFFRELETDAERAYPDNQKFAEILIKFFNQTSSERLQESIKVRQATIQRYNWNDTANIWEKYLHSYQRSPLQEAWDSPPKITNVPQTIKSNLSHEDFVKWIFYEVLQTPEKIYEFEAKRILRDLTLGAQTGFGVLEPLNQNQVFNAFKQKATYRNQSELRRVGQLPTPPDQFITEAHQVYQASKG